MNVQLNFKNLSKKQIFTLIALAFIVISGLLFSSFFAMSNYEMLYQANNASEIAPIVQFLNKIGEDYEIQEKKILVKSENVRRLRMSLAAENIISNNSIIGYEIFNKPDTLGSSSFTQNINLIRSLEGELSRTIMSFNNIKYARVHLVVPKKEFFSTSNAKTTASVMLKVMDNNDLSNKQIIAIANLIASAVPNLDKNNITIVSSEGKPYKIGRDEDESASYFQEYKMEIERNLKKSVESLIENIVGPGKVKAEINAEIDFDKLIVDSEKYNPDEQVVRSTQNVEDSSQENDNNTSVSVANNISNDGGESSGKSSNAKHSEEIKNYEISKETKRYIKEIGTIKKLSVAVLVDGTYIKDPNSNNMVYTPIPQESLTNMRNLIASAVGFDKERGDILEVINMNFLRNDESLFEDNKSFIINWAQENLSMLVKTCVVVMLFLVALLVVIKPTLDKLFGEKIDATKATQGDLSTSAKAEEVEPQKTKREELTKKLEEIVAKSNSTVVEILRNLMMKDQ